jgi:hypothetical protein
VGVAAGQASHEDIFHPPENPKDLVSSLLKKQLSIAIIFDINN